MIKIRINYLIILLKKKLVFRNEVLKTSFDSALTINIQKNESESSEKSLEDLPDDVIEEDSRSKTSYGNTIK